MLRTTRRALAVGVLALFATAQAFAATLYISEFFNQGPPAGYQIAATPELTHQTVTVSSSSTQSAAFSSQTTIIRLFADAAMCVQIGGTNPTATSTSMPLAANQTEYFATGPNQKLAVISCTP
jgi:hypothetical protein